MARVLVTGATGLIGQHVSASLAARDFDVHGVARRLGHQPCVTLHACDLLDPIATSQLVEDIRPDIVVHCAWITTHAVYWQSPANLTWLTASLSLLRATQQSGTRRFIGVGTCAEHAVAEADSDVRTLATLYGTSKDAFRRVGEQFAANEHLEFAWTRVFMLYGAGEHPDRFIASLARALVSGQPARMSSGTVVRDFLDARDVGAAIAAVAASELTGTVDIGSGHAISLRTAGQLLAEISGRPDLFAPGALPDRAGEPLSLVADVSRLQDEIGYLPAITLDRGFRDALEYWRERRGV
jgi:nucleoside-diphosphate-sugar epimerase